VKRISASPMPTYRPCVSVVCAHRSHSRVRWARKRPRSHWHMSTITHRRAIPMHGAFKIHPLPSRFQALMRLSCLFNVMGETGRSVDQTAVRSPETWQRCLVSSPRRLLARLVLFSLREFARPEQKGPPPPPEFRVSSESFPRGTEAESEGCSSSALNAWLPLLGSSYRSHQLGRCSACAWLRIGLDGGL